MFNESVNNITGVIMTIAWVYKTFDELSKRELYECIALREKIFVVEQQDMYLDCDGKDIDSWHLIGCDGEKIVAYSRVYLSNIEGHDVVHFGRVCLDKDYRGTGLGKTMLQEMFNFIKDTGYGHLPLEISAQEYLIKFYEDFEFNCYGDIYMEGSIPHIRMAHKPLV